MLSPYLILFFFLIAISFRVNEKNNDRLSKLVALVLGAFLALRFGQGTDWPAYCYIYLSSPEGFNFNSSYFGNGIHSDIGWKVLNTVFHSIGISYIHFSVIISVIEIYYLYKFIRKYSDNGVLSFLLLYPSVYFIYMFSTLRQGLVIAIFLGQGLHLLQEDKYAKYIILSSLLVTIHSSALAFFLLLVIKKQSVKSLYICLIPAFLIGLSGNLWIPRLLSYFGDAGIYSTREGSPAAFSYQIVIFSLITMLYLGSNKQAQNTSDIYLMKVYLFGLALYLLLSTNSLVASRFSVPFMAVECALVSCYLCAGIDRRQQMLLVSVICLAATAMLIKNLNYVSSQSLLPADRSGIYYPYFSLFNHEDFYKLYSGYYVNATQQLFY